MRNALIRLLKWALSHLEPSIPAEIARMMPKIEKVEYDEQTKTLKIYEEGRCRKVELCEDAVSIISEEWYQTPYRIKTVKSGMVGGRYMPVKIVFMDGSEVSIERIDCKTVQAINGREDQDES